MDNIFLANYDGPHKKFADIAFYYEMFSGPGTVVEHNIARSAHRRAAELVRRYGVKVKVPKLQIMKKEFKVGSYYYQSEMGIVRCDGIYDTVIEFMHFGEDKARPYDLAIRTDMLNCERPWRMVEVEVPNVSGL